MNPIESSSEDEPIAVIKNVIKAEAVAPGDGEWDIEAALTRRGPYPSWDLDWLQQLLSDKIKHLSNIVHEMQEKNHNVESGILSRLAQLQDFSKILKRYAAES